LNKIFFFAAEYQSALTLAAIPMTQLLFLVIHQVVPLQCLERAVANFEQAKVKKHERTSKHAAMNRHFSTCFRYSSATTILLLLARILRGPLGKSDPGQPGRTKERIHFAEYYGYVSPIAPAMTQLQQWAKRSCLGLISGAMEPVSIFFPLLQVRHRCQQLTRL